jgi:LAO/AO transport system kinase
MRASGELQARRRAQAVSWMWEIIEQALRDRFGSSPEVQRELPALAAAVQQGSVAATVAARRLLTLAGLD